MRYANVNIDKTELDSFIQLYQCTFVIDTYLIKYVETF